MVRDRFEGTAVLTRQQALDLGTLGYVARASGVAVDARHDHPVAGLAYRPVVHSRTVGDVLSRFLVRAEEIDASVGSIADLVQQLGAATADGASSARTSQQYRYTPV